MSFADVKKGGARKPARQPAYQGEYQGSGNDLERERLRQEITSNLSNMERKVSDTKKEVKKLGSKKDTAELREHIEELQRDQMQLRESTLHMLKSFKEASRANPKARQETNTKRAGPWSRWRWNRLPEDCRGWRG